MYVIMGCRMKLGGFASNTESLPNELYAFYTGFEQIAIRILSTLSVSDAFVPMVTEVDVRSAFLKVNAWKATGPDGVPPQII